jgi:hypothetical protein
MATPVLTAYAKTTWGAQVLAAYTQSNRLSNDYFIYTYEPGMPNKVYPKTISASAKHEADGTAVAGSSATAEATTVTVDSVPLKRYDKFTYQSVNTFGTEIPSWHAKQFGRDLAALSMNCKASFIALCALGESQIGANNYRQDGNGIVTFDQTLTGEEAGQAVFDAILDAHKQLDHDLVPQDGRVVVLDPSIGYDTYKSKYIANMNYNNSGGTQKGVESRVIAETPMIVTPTIFNSDQSANTNVLSKYRYDFTNVADQGPLLGFVFYDQAFALHEVEKANGGIVDFPNEFVWQVHAREHWGMATCRTVGAIALVGTNGT